MRIEQQVVRLGFEFRYPTPHKAVVEVERNVTKLNVIERIRDFCLQLFGYVGPDAIPPHRRHAMSIFMKTGLQTIQRAERVWDLTNMQMLKERYEPERKLTSVDLEYFEDAVPMSKEQLQEFLGIDITPIFK